MTQPGSGIQQFGLGRIASRLGLMEKLFLLLLVSFAILRAFPLSAGLRLAVTGGLLFTGCWIGIRALRRGMNKLIWRLRNRLLVAYLFIAVVPVVVILILAAAGAWYLGGQVAVYLVNKEFERRLETIDRAARALARTAPTLRSRALERVGANLREIHPGATVLLDQGAQLVAYPADIALDSPPAGWLDSSGVVVKHGLLYGWAVASSDEVRVTVLAPLTRRFFEELAPGLGEISVVDLGQPSRPAAPLRTSFRPHERGPERKNRTARGCPLQ